MRLSEYVSKLQKVIDKYGDSDCINEMQLGIWYGDKVALEDIENGTICVRTDDGIRRLNNEEDLKENIVLVYNIPTMKQDTQFTIKKGKMVRYLLPSI